MSISKTTTDNCEFAALVGIDWADEKHDICLLEMETQRQEPSELKHSAESIDEWAIKLRDRFGGRPVAICLEQARGSLVYALMKYEHLVLFPLNPLRLKSFRQAVCSSGAKDDPTDASLLLQYLTQHRQHLTAWKPDDALTRQISLLVEQRRQAVELRKKLSNRLRSALKQYFPQILTWAGDELHSKLSCDLVVKWPTLRAIQKASPNVLRKFFYGHNSRNEERLLQRLEQIRDAKPLVSDLALIEGYSLTAILLAKQLLELNQSIDVFDKALAKLLSQHPDGSIFKSFPGAGDVMAPRLLAAFGSDRSRITTPAAMQSLSGVAPVTKRSGRSYVVHRRYACPKFLRQTFHEYAGHSLLKSSWARAFYRMQRERGQSHHTAIRALAYKWIRILFRCWQERTPYDEIKYITALQRRSSPLLKYLEQPQTSCG